MCALVCHAFHPSDQGTGPSICEPSTSSLIMSEAEDRHQDGWRPCLPSLSLRMSPASRRERERVWLTNCSFLPSEEIRAGKNCYKESGGWRGDPCFPAAPNSRQWRVVPPVAASLRFATPSQRSLARTGRRRERSPRIPPSFPEILICRASFAAFAVTKTAGRQGRTAYQQAKGERERQQGGKGVHVTSSNPFLPDFISSIPRSSLCVSRSSS